VLLLSATPINNDLHDVRNQTSILSGGADRALGESLDIDSLEQTSRVAQRTFSKWARTGGERRDPTRSERPAEPCDRYSTIEALSR